MSGGDIVRQQALDRIAEAKALLADLVVMQADMDRLDLRRSYVDVSSSILVTGEEIAALVREQAEADRVNRGAK